MPLYDEKLLRQLDNLLCTEDERFDRLIELAGLDPSVDLRFADFREVDFFGSLLVGYDFTGADLRGASFRGAQIANCIFTDAQGVDLTGAHELASAPQTVVDNALADIRTGIGYDIHAFDSGGDHVWLGGVKIPHGKKLAGHSDADVALHALTDAILGALADGDIGVHFPPTDEKWRGASSDTFLAFAVERVKARGGVVSHLDVAIVCEAPKINPRRDEMRARIAEIAGLSIDRVGVKATTNEKLGAIGRAEGIAAYATATIRLPWTTP